MDNTLTETTPVSAISSFKSFIYRRCQLLRIYNMHDI